MTALPEVGVCSSPRAAHAFRHVRQLVTSKCSICEPRVLTSAPKPISAGKPTRKNHRKKVGTSSLRVLSQARLTTRCVMRSPPQSPLADSRNGKPRA